MWQGPAPLAGVVQAGQCTVGADGHRRRPPRAGLVVHVQELAAGVEGHVVGRGPPRRAPLHPHQRASAEVEAEAGQRRSTRGRGRDHQALAGDRGGLRGSVGCGARLAWAVARGAARSTAAATVATAAATGPSAAAGATAAAAGPGAAAAAARGAATPPGAAAAGRARAATAPVLFPPLAPPPPVPPRPPPLPPWRSGPRRLPTRRRCRPADSCFLRPPPASNRRRPGTSTSDGQSSGAWSTGASGLSAPEPSRPERCVSVSERDAAVNCPPNLDRVHRQ